MGRKLQQAMWILTEHKEGCVQAASTKGSCAAPKVVQLGR